MKNEVFASKLRQRLVLRAIVQGMGLLILAGVVSMSAVVTKEARSRARFDPLAAVSEVPMSDGAIPAEMIEPGIAEAPIIDPLAVEAASPRTAENSGLIDDTSIRFFNGRPIRPAKTMWMTVTAYSPDARSCGDSADGITSSIHSVWTNAMKLAAADTRLLPLGSMISVPGYDEGRVIPVLDRGGAIKGSRLDMLYATHEAARQWGTQRLLVTVWEYADGKPKDDYRAIRDSKRAAN